MNSHEMPPKSNRTQFPLWFLLFVIPTIAGLAIAIFTNWRQQAQVRADLIAHREVLQARIQQMDSEIALVQQVDKQIRSYSNHWKSPTVVVQHLQRMGAHDGAPAKDIYEVDRDHELSTFFVQANVQELKELLQLIREAYPQCDPATQSVMLDVAVNIPNYAPDAVTKLTEQARQLEEVLPKDGPPQLKQQASQLRQAFQLGDSPNQPEQKP